MLPADAHQQCEVKHEAAVGFFFFVPHLLQNKLAKIKQDTLYMMHAADSRLLIGAALW